MGEQFNRKCVTVGDGTCGKTCMLIRAFDDKYDDTYVPTVFENHVTSQMVDDKKVELAVWDTSGQDSYDRLRPLAYSNAHAILLCFSIADKDSYDNAEVKWIREVRHFCPKQPVILIGCKSDAREDPSVCTTMGKPGGKPVERSQIDALVKKIGAVTYLECSAKTGAGIKDIFPAVARITVQPPPPKKPSCILM